MTFSHGSDWRRSTIEIQISVISVPNPNSMAAAPSRGSIIVRLPLTKRKPRQRLAAWLSDEAHGSYD